MPTSKPNKMSAMLRSMNKKHWLESRLDTYLGDRIKKEYKQKDHFSPSSLSDCPRENYFIYMGTVPEKEMSPNLQRIFDFGHDVHERYYRYFKSMGILHACEIPIKKDMPPITAIADAVIKLEGSDKLYLAELKSKGGREDADMFGKLDKPDRAHILQWNVYSDIMDIPEGFILYESKAHQGLKIFDMVRDDSFIEELYGMLIAVLGHVEKGTVPPKMKKCTNRYCGFKTLCKKAG
jgi:hypothetical protein